MFTKHFFIDLFGLFVPLYLYNKWETVGHEKELKMFR